jgi:single-strand DNA-binding protein
MKVIGLARIGRDAELRKTPNGDSVINLALAFSYGRKADGEKYKPTQWVDASLWGKRAEALEQYLNAGGLVDVILADVHIETYEGNNGPSTKLVGRVLEIDLAGGGDGGGQQGGGQRSQGQAPQQRQAAPQGRAPAPTQQRAPQGRAAAGGGGWGNAFSDMDDDIPFVFADYSTDFSNRKAGRARGSR